MSAILTLIFGVALAVAGVFLLSVVFTIPIYFLYNWLAPTYFTFLPEAWHQIPLLHVWGLVFLYSIVFKSSTSNSKSD